MRKLMKVLLASMALLLIVGCSSGGNKSSDAGSVYYLNFKPEIADQIEELAKEYTEETGVKVKVVTAAQGNYESTLAAEVAKSEPPTAFFINGPVGFQNWKDYALDLSDTKLYDWLLDKGMAVTGEDDGVYGIPITVEGYGIIYNKAILNKYFESANKSTDYNSMDEINNFDALQAVVEDMTNLKEELGIEGVFSSTSLASGDQWRWHTHLANIPVYYEYKDKDISSTDALQFRNVANSRNVFELYLNTAVVELGRYGAKTSYAASADLVLGQFSMVQSGNCAWGQVAFDDANMVAEYDIGPLAHS